jgi:glutathione S-transferase
MPHPLILWGSELSPFSLKTRAVLEWAEIPHQWLPDHGSRWQNLRAAWQIERAKRTRTAIRHPATSPLDEYPLVPFVLDGTATYYDSTAIARWIDETRPAAGGPLVPPDPATAFVTAFVDEAFDEVGLYLAHHFRWVVSAQTNDAGRRLAHEMRHHAPPGGPAWLARWFPRRQVRRLPYLFSVAAPDAPRPALPAGLIPPSRPGFPPTHALLEGIWERWIDAIERLLTRRPFLLGERFTLADASVYGTFGMNLADPTAAARMRERAPATFAWLERLRAQGHVGSRGPVGLGPELAPLLDALRTTFSPLMHQNERAWDAARAAGETCFNERGFDRGRGLYDGEILGQPFRSVVKTFQVRAWRELRHAWRGLDPHARERVQAVAGGTPLDLSPR